jgi:hypothetical protein
MIRAGVLLSLSAAVSACVPPTYSGDYSVPFARSYWAARPDARPALASLRVEQLYSLNQYGRRAFHPWRTMAPAFGCRGAEAVPFLKSKITPKTVGGLLELFLWMDWMSTYDPVADSDLMAGVHGAYAQMPKVLRKTYAGDLAALERRRQTAAHLPAERLRATYCSSLDSSLARG